MEFEPPKKRPPASDDATVYAIAVMVFVKLPVVPNIDYFGCAATPTTHALHKPLAAHPSSGILTNHTFTVLEIECIRDLLPTAYGLLLLQQVLRTSTTTTASTTEFTTEKHIYHCYKLQLIPILRPVHFTTCCSNASYDHNVLSM